MNPEIYRRACDIFDEACDLPPAARERYVVDACGDDAQLARLVRELLEHDLPSTTAPVIPLRLEHEFEPGQRVRGFRILRRIGDGGMGDVYVAEQLEPIRRMVALKIVRVGMDTHQLLGRFELERQVLALMDHPGIAKVYDAGTTEGGRPYFAMEYVDGLHVTRYADVHEMDIPARLVLFTHICQAVQHAHQKGVIHRDLKPSNVLVTEVDGVAIPKVIDFGVAKALEQPFGVETLHTMHGMVLGTPDYMSPEQAAAVESPDTRTDVYSLGVILYELLVGHRPIELGDSGVSTVESMRRAIVEVEPKRPSTRLQELGGAACAIAASRATDVVRLQNVLRSDLDWIVMRAIEKDRARRYDSASELAADVERYLEGEPVVARPPTVAYRVGKYVRRHRYFAASASAVTITLLLGITATTWQAREARDRLHRMQAASELLVSRFYELADQVGGMETKRTLGQLAVVTLDDIATRRNLTLDDRRQLANAYEALAQVQGDAYSSSLGLVAEARGNVLKAHVLRRGAYLADSTNTRLATEFVKNCYMVGSMHQGDPSVAGVDSIGLAIALRFLQEEETPELMVLASMCDVLLAEREHERGNSDVVMGYLEHALALRERLYALDPANDEYVRLLADGYKTVSYATPDDARSLELAGKALKLNEEYAARNPFRWRGLMDLAYAHRNLGYAMRRQRDFDGELEQMKACLAVRERMAAADTLDLRVRHYVSDGCHLVGSAFENLAMADSARLYHDRGLAILQRLDALDNPPFWCGYELSYSLSFAAGAAAETGDTTRARLLYARGLEHETLGSPTAALKAFRANDEYLHFLDAMGDHIEAVRQHMASVELVSTMGLGMIDARASQSAMADVVSAYCHIACFVAPTDLAFADSVAGLAVVFGNKTLGDSHPLTARALALRGSLLAMRGRLAESEAVYDEALAFLPDCVIARRAEAAMIRANLATLASAKDRAASVACPGFLHVDPADGYVTARLRLIKRNRLWGKNDWPAVAALNVVPAAGVARR